MLLSAMIYIFSCLFFSACILIKPFADYRFYSEIIFLAANVLGILFVGFMAVTGKFPANIKNAMVFVFVLDFIVLIIIVLLRMMR